TATLTDPCKALGKRVQFRRGLPTGDRSQPIRQGTRPPQVIASHGAIGCSGRFRMLRFWAVAHRSSSATPLRRVFQKPQGERYGDLPAHVFHIVKDNAARPPDGARPCFFRLTFERSVRGPLAFDWASHRALGLFVPRE